MYKHVRKVYGHYIGHLFCKQGLYNLFVSTGSTFSDKEKGG